MGMRPIGAPQAASLRRRRGMRSTATGTNHFEVQGGSRQAERDSFFTTEGTENTEGDSKLEDSRFKMTESLWQIQRSKNRGPDILHISCDLLDTTSCGD